MTDPHRADKIASALREVNAANVRRAAGIPDPVDPDSIAGIARRVIADQATQEAERLLLAAADERRDREDAERYAAIMARRNANDPGLTIKETDWANRYATDRERAAYAAKRASLTQAEIEAEGAAANELADLTHRAWVDGDPAAKAALDERRRAADIEHMRAQVADFDAQNGGQEQ